MKLSFITDKCIGCKLCQLACSATQEGIFNPHKARLRVYSEYLPEGGIKKGAAICDYCQICIESCPAGAISIEEGYLSLAKESCTGCGECVNLCPNEVITLDQDGFPRLCNLCGGAPKCAVWCPHGALEVE